MDGSCALGESVWLDGSGWSGVPSLACSGYSLAILSDPKVFSNGNIVFDDPKDFDDLLVSDGVKVISNESMDFKDTRNCPEKVMKIIH